MLALVAVFQLLARALSEFSLPHVQHPCLLLEAQQINLVRARLSKDPWRGFWEATLRNAQAPERPRDWAGYARILRANATAYVLSGDPDYAARAASMLRRFPSPLGAARLSCRNLSKVALQWAQAYDLLHAYLAQRHQLLAASWTTSRIAHRLYYTTYARDAAPEIARLWRACALAACGLALADFHAPSELVSPRAVYAEGCGELRACLRKALSGTVISDPAKLSEAFEALVPVAIALQRVSGESALQTGLVSRAAAWALAARLPDGTRLGPGGQKAPFPAYLMTAAQLYPEAFAWDFVRATGSSARAPDPVDALCYLAPVQPESPPVVQAVAVDSFFALHTAWPELGGVAVGGCEVCPITSSSAGHVTKLLCSLFGRGQMGQVSVNIAMPRQQQQSSYLAETLSWLRGPGPVPTATASLAGNSFPTARLVLPQPDGSTGVVVELAIAPGPAVVLHCHAPSKDSELVLRVSSGSWRALVLANSQGAAQETVSTGAARYSTKLAPAASLVIALMPRTVMLRQFSGTERSVTFRVVSPALPDSVYLTLPREGRAVDLPGATAEASAAVWRAEGEKPAEVLLLGGSVLCVGGRTVWQASTPSIAWWSGGPNRTAKAD